MENNKKVIDFDLPEDKSIIDVIYDVLEKNGLGLGEDPDTWPDESEETQAMIIRSAAITIFQKKIPGEKLIEFLQKHLKTSKETAENIVTDIKEKLIPYAIVIEEKKMPELSVQEILLEKIKNNVSFKENPPLPITKVKKVEIKNVEDNAELHQRDKIYTDEMKKIIQEEPKKEILEKNEGVILVEPQKEEKKTVTEDQSNHKNSSTDTYREPIE